MIKKLFYLFIVAAVVAFTSCSKDEPDPNTPLPEVKDDFEVYYKDADGKLVQATGNNTTVTVTKTSYLLFPERGEMEFAGEVVNNTDKTIKMITKATRDNVEGYDDQFCGESCILGDHKSSQVFVLKDKLEAKKKHTFEAHLIPETSSNGLDRKITYEFYTDDNPVTKVTIAVVYKHEAKSN